MKNSSLSGRIRDVMIKEGMTQQDLAISLEMSQPAISSYLRGRIPPADVLYKIARIGQTTVEWLLLGDSISEPIKVKEKSEWYDNQQQLMDLWVSLSAPVQKNLLILMRHLASKMDS